MTRRADDGHVPLLVLFRGHRLRRDPLAERPAPATAIYVRASNEEQVQGLSLDAQEKACGAYREARGSG